MADTLEKFLISIGFEVETEKANTESDKILARFRAQSAKAAEFVSGVFKRAATLSVAALGSVAAAGIGALHHYTELGSEVGSLSEKLGIGTRELQRLQAAQTASGGSADALKDALKTMTVGFQEAATKGSGPFWEGLKLVGVQLEELEGLNSEEQIGLLADALNEIKDPADKTATSLKLFGEAGGLELGGLLKRGSAGIRELGDEAERLGLVLDEDAIAGARKLKASFGQLEAVGSVVVARVGEQLAPALSDAADRALDWVESNDQFIQQDLPAAIEGVISSIGSLVTWLVDVQAEMRQFGREVGYAYDEAAQLAEGVGEIATQVSDFLEPAIDVALTPLRAMVDVFLAIQGVVVDVVTNLADMVGILDDVKAAYNRLPFVGEGAPDADTRAGDFGRGPTAFLGAGSQATADATAERRRAEQASRPEVVLSALFGAAGVQGAAEALAAEGRDRAKVSASRAGARLAGRAALAPKASGGGGGGSSKAASSGKGGILDKLGLGGLFEDHSGTGLAGLLGIGGGEHAAAGGGSSPLAGATFATQTVNTTATIEIVLPPGALAGLSNPEQADLIARSLRERLAEENRRALDYVQGPVRRG